MPPKILFQVNREIKMSQNKVSERNCNIKILHKKAFKSSSVKKLIGICISSTAFMYNLFKVGISAKIHNHLSKPMTQTLTK